MPRRRNLPEASFSWIKAALRSTPHPVLKGIRRALAGKFMSPEETATLIKDGMRRSTRAGDSKAVPLALAAHAE